MRKIAYFTALAFGLSLTFATTTQAQKGIVHPNSCDPSDCGDPGGGGGGDPRTPPPPGPYVIFPAGYNYASLQIGGIYDREGPAATVFGENLYIAWTALNDPYGDQANTSISFMKMVQEEETMGRTLA